MIRTPSMRREFLQRIAGQRRLVIGDHLHPDVLQVVDGRAEADGLRGHRHAGLEPGRRRGVGGVVDEDLLDHRAAGEERGHRGQQLVPAVEHADAAGPEHLVPGERREVDVQRGHVDRLMRDRLAGVQHGERADPLRGGDQHVHRVDGAEHVGLVGERDHLRPRGDHLVQVRQVEPEVVGHLEPAQRGPGAAAEFLPGHQIRVVFHLGDDDLVAGPEPESARRRIIGEASHCPASRRPG